MFTQPPEVGERKRRIASLLVSFGLQGLLLLALLHRPAAVFIHPSDVDQGILGSSGSLSIVYLAPVGAEAPQPAVERPQPLLRASVPRTPASPKATRPQPPTDRPTAANALEQTAQGGSPYGRVPGSALTGDEVVPALPEVFPDPPVARADLPSGVEGDVIVEVTIDQQGNVVETKLIQGIGYGIEEKVLAVLQRWHFRPAMRDGLTIASQHLVHFHYPS
jgi:TonB family protein